MLSKIVGVLFYSALIGTIVYLFIKGLIVYGILGIVITILVAMLHIAISALGYIGEGIVGVFSKR